VRRGRHRDLDAVEFEHAPEVHRLHPVQPMAAHPVPELGDRDDPRADAVYDGEQVAEVVVMAVRDQGKVERADVTQLRRAQRIAMGPGVDDDLAPLRAGQPERRVPQEGHLATAGGAHGPHGPGLAAASQGDGQSEL
jgi:hypothetical protein